MTTIRQRASRARLLILTSLVLAMSNAPARASSANFVLSSQDIDLGQPEEVFENGQPQPPRYATKVELGQPFTLIAQGWVYPRSSDPKVAKGSPATAEAARWRFDDEDFKLLEHDARHFDETMTVVRLQPTTIGRTRIRFQGQVLGYERTFDILIDIIAAKE
ncbi:MAG TPA: hypothetical protein VNA16_06865 [Abditibacteriaceae bacterium]|nr:hypothetical protein [Abditibacteriaceae bacterium]